MLKKALLTDRRDHDSRRRSLSPFGRTSGTRRIGNVAATLLGRTELRRARSRPRPAAQPALDAGRRSRRFAASRPSPRRQSHRQTRLKRRLPPVDTAPSRGYWPDFRGPGSRRPLRRDADSRELALRRTAALVETTDRPRLRVVRGRRRPRVHDRTAPQPGSRLGIRRRNGPRAVDQRVERGVHRGNGRRWTARDADVSRRTNLRARRTRGVPLPGRGNRLLVLAPQHPRRCRRVESRLGHGRFAADCRRCDCRVAGRAAREVGRGLQQVDGRAALDVA